MTKKLWAIILSLMLAFSLSLITGCQKAKEKAGEVKEEATETKAEIKEKAVETAEEIKEEAAETVKEVKEEVAETAEETKEEAAETVKEVKEIAVETAEDTEEAKLKEIEPPVETKTVPAPTLIVEPDYSVTGSTVWVTLEWNTVTNPYGNPVKYSLSLYSGDGFIYSSGWVSGTNWARSIPNPCNYSWKVKARDDVYLQESEWSTADSFLVNTYCSSDDD